MLVMCFAVFTEPVLFTIVSLAGKVSASGKEM